MKLNPQDWAVTARDGETATLQHRATGHVRFVALDSAEFAKLGDPPPPPPPPLEGQAPLGNDPDEGRFQPSSTTGPAPETATLDLAAAERRSAPETDESSAKE